MRNAYIDFLRGISIIGVIIIHLKLFLDEKNPIYLGFDIADTLFRFAVPFFIGILGYMTVEKYCKQNDWKKFYTNKFFVVFVPFLLWSFIYLFSPKVFPDYMDNHLKITSFLLGFSEVQLYFVIAYLSFIILTPIATWGIKHSKRSILTWICLLLIIAHTLLLHVIDGGAMNEFIILYWNSGSRLFIHWITFYCFGILFGLYKADIIIHSERFSQIMKYAAPAFFLVHTLLAVFFALTREIHIYLSDFLVYLSISGFFLFTSLYFIIKELKLTKYICYVGKNSYAIFLFHILPLKLSFLFLFSQETSIIALVTTGMISLISSILYIPFHNQFMSRVIGKNLIAKSK